MRRRHFLQSSLPLLTGLPTLRSRGQEATAETLPPVRQITRGPKFHWFGYYDKMQFDPTNRFVLSNEVDFEGRTPSAGDRIRVGMVDLEDGDRWTDLGKSDAWGWQQGCMLQWRPGHGGEVIWNDREGGQFVSHLLDTATGKQRTLPHPIYALSPDGSFGVTADFSRIQRLRPGYGYQGVPDATAEVPRPENSGVWRVNLDTGERTLLVSIAEIADHGRLPHEVPGSHHWFNHLLVSPDGKRLIFLHRWKIENGRWLTRMLTANASDGSDVRLIDDNGLTSHFIWRDPEQILAWSKHADGPAFYVFKDAPAPDPKPIGLGVMTVDGHCTYLPKQDHQWVLCDTYPDKERKQNPYLFSIATGKKHPLGHFYSPAPYAGEWRCDTHPRHSNDGRMAVIDSPHAGGRQLHLIDLSGMVG